MLSIACAWYLGRWFVSDNGPKGVGLMRQTSKDPNSCHENRRRGLIESKPAENRVVFQDGSSGPRHTWSQIEQA